MRLQKVTCLSTVSIDPLCSVGLNNLPLTIRTVQASYAVLVSLFCIKDFCISWKADLQAEPIPAIDVATYKEQNLQSKFFLGQEQ